MYLHFDPQSPVRSRPVTPVTKFQPVSSPKVEEVEMNPRFDVPSPSSSSLLSVAESITSWEQRAALENRQGTPSASTPKRDQSPAGPSSSQEKKTVCYRRRKGACFASPTYALDLIERSYRVSKLAVGGDGMKL